ncbi:MAG TPA: hypothetical protein DCY74_08450 [Clostridiales bacterium]|jgi:Na+-transporting methylmalonyl-CoA/oxaloacetate decarboxylase gamma subunit|nr:hypothetical protein [Clostridiales bacterium]HBE14186.1 hypothetical protein [Clostridiales bacterium]HCG34820.1 hypothetical protein [Clostridiales bacterium]
MTVLESTLNALFCMSIVFAVLIILYIIIRFFSIIIGNFNRVETACPIEREAESAPNLNTVPHVSCGTMKLIGVDEPTAAMVMAIVSDKTDIPLEELCFKSIKAIE